MNPLPSSSHVPTFRNYNIAKLLDKKRYIPRIPASRTSKVKEEESTEIKKDEAKPSTERSRPIRGKKILTGAETFVPVVKTHDSRVIIKSRPKIIHSPSNSSSSNSSSSNSIVKKEVVDRNGPSREPLKGEVPVIKTCAGKFDHISSAPPEDLPVAVPRPRLALPSQDDKPHKLLMDLFDPSGDESPLFILKTPKYLPRVVDNATNSQAHSSKNEVKNEVQKCTIHDLPEGCIGKLQIMKSGRLRLVLGECKFWLHRGVRVNFREELVFVNTEPESRTGEIVNLGDIKDRIIAVPDSVTVLTKDDPR